MPLDLPFSQVPPFDAAKTHRWLAIEFNNIAWDLFEKELLTPSEAKRMIHVAHASALHWSQVGKPVNDVRGEILVAHVYAKVKLVEATGRHAKHCLELAKTCADDLSPFDLALMLGVAAWGESLAGNKDQAESYLNQALEAATKMTNADAKQVFDKYVRLYQA